MDIYRGQSGERTDSKEPSAYIEDWQRRVEDWGDGGMVRFDGTIDKDGTRHTDLWIHIHEEDVIALFDALVKAYRQRASALETWDASTAPPGQRRRPKQLREGVRKIWRSFLTTGMQFRRISDAGQTRDSEKA
jgi:hypothetical protein